MQMLRNSYNGLSLIMSLNWDRLLYLGTMFVALAASAYVAANI